MGVGDKREILRPAGRREEAGIPPLVTLTLIGPLALGLGLGLAPPPPLIGRRHSPPCFQGRAYPTPSRLSNMADGGTDYDNNGAERTCTLGLARRDAPVVLDVSGRLFTTKLAPPFKLATGRDYIHVKSLIGSPFGAEFALGEKGRLERVEPEKAREAELARDWAVLFADARSNANIDYQPKPDVVTHDTVNDLKRKGVSGDEIVASIIESSTTFQEKTAFSQAKYIKKKMKKHNPRVVLRRATALAVAEAQHLNANSSASNGSFVPPAAVSRALRYDALALMLHHGGAVAGAEVLVLDGSRGLLTAAVAERVGGAGNGSVVALPDDFRYTTGTRGPASAFHQVDLDDDVRNSVRYTTPCDLAEALGKTVPESMRKQETDKIWAEKDAPPPRATQEGLRSILRDRGGFGSLLATSGRMSPASTLRELLPLLAPGASFIIHSPYLSAVSEACAWMHENRLAVNLSVFDTFLREHQALPNRSHPHMNATPSQSGGYFVSGVKCNSTTNR